LEFVEAVKSHGKRLLAVGLEDGLMSVGVGLAAQKSIETGTFVLLKEILGRKA